jgi:MOSC domain-containing protein YiiM
VGATGEPTTAGILGVFVGRPQVIGEVRGRPVESGIAKAAVGDTAIELGLTNLDGDRQADLTVHGGRDKAVYVYPSEHYAAWQADGFDLSVGGVGENVALAGAAERDVLLGDRWRWGSALVEVTQPRAPCYKFALHTGRKDVGPRMIETGRTGWYLRVLETGTVPTRGPMTLVGRAEGAPSVYDTFRVIFPNGAVASPEAIDRVLASPALADSWRTVLLARR